MMSSLSYSSSSSNNSSISNRTQQTQERRISPSSSVSSNEEERLLRSQNIFRGIKEKEENSLKAVKILNDNPQLVKQKLLTAEDRVPSNMDLISFLKKTNNPMEKTSRLNPHAEPFIPASQRSLNPHAEPFIPASQRGNNLKK